MTSPEALLPAVHPTAVRTGEKKGLFWRCLLLEPAVLLLVWVGIQMTPSPDVHPAWSSNRSRISFREGMLSYHLFGAYRIYPSAQTVLATIAPAVIAAGVLIACSRKQLPLALLSGLVLGIGATLLLPTVVTPKDDFQIKLSLIKQDLAAYSEADLTREFQAQHLLACPLHSAIRPNAIYAASATTRLQFERNRQEDWCEVTVRTAIPVSDSLSKSLLAADAEAAFPVADSYQDINYIRDSIFLSALATCREISASRSDPDVEDLRRAWSEYIENYTGGSGFDDWMKRRAEWRKAHPLPERQGGNRGAR